VLKVKYSALLYWDPASKTKYGSDLVINCSLQMDKPVGLTRIGPTLCPSPKTNLNKGQKSLVKDVLTKLSNLLRTIDH